MGSNHFAHFHCPNAEAAVTWPQVHSLLSSLTRPNGLTAKGFSEIRKCAHEDCSKAALPLSSRCARNCLEKVLSLGDMLVPRALLYEGQRRCGSRHAERSSNEAAC